MSEHASSAVAREPPSSARDGPWRLPVAGGFALAAAAVAATAGAVAMTAVSRHAPNPTGHALLSVVVCLSFVGAGLLALRRPPYVRFGVLLAAVGFSSLLGAFHDANAAIPYTAGVLTANLVFAVLVYALLAFPYGRLGSRTNRLLVLVAFVNVLLLQAVAVLFDPLTRWHSAHPRNAALVDSHASLATVLEELEAAVAIGITVAVAAVLFRRTRMKTALARRELVPVLVGGVFALLAFAIGLVFAPISSDAAVVGIGLGLLASLALPAAFLLVLLKGRLSRAAVGELLVELREGTAAPGLEDALRRALGDPSLQLARRAPDGSYRVAGGHAVSLRSPDCGVATLIEHHGEPVGMLLHDPSLRLRPELLEAVTAAAGFALASERALETVRRVEDRDRALLDAIPDSMYRLNRDGICLDVRTDEPATLFNRPEEMIGRHARELLPEWLADSILACATRALDTGRTSYVEYEIEFDGVLHSFETRMVPSGNDEVVAIRRDVTEERRAQAEQRQLAEEQAALRRVATLVAGDPPPEQVFQAVTEEIARLLGISEALLERFNDDDSVVIVGRFGRRSFEVGNTTPLEEGLAAWKVRATGAPAHSDSFDEMTTAFSAQIRELGYGSSFGVPITVGGAMWGVLIAALGPDESLPPDTERRMQAFAELVALAVASAQARQELAASRVRIVEASDAERRRLERNLHDGAQQRLVALSVGVRLAQGKVRGDPDEAAELLEMASEELAEALTELRDLAQGIHPAVLTEQGLEAALEVIAARAPLPVELEVRLPERLPEPIEATAYYVVSEALANVVKHSDADSARVFAEGAGLCALVEVADDGVGGADPSGGSGLRGLRDRIEALDGTVVVESPPGRGTLVRAELPLPSRVGDGAAVET
ncbi:MAG TPA: histidine kinase [Gaiellaceae bacterium]